MKFALLLHAYQPPTQFREMTARIVKESYWPIVETLRGIPNSKLTLNLTGSLTEQLHDLGEDRLLREIGQLVKDGFVELTSTAMYHPLLARLPKDEIERQMRLNDKVNHQLLNLDDYRPRGVFIPEMFYKRHVAEAIANLDYSWMIVDESAFPGAGVIEKGQHARLEIGKYLYEFNGLPLYAFFRNRPLSLEIAFRDELVVDQFVDLMKENYLNAQESYVVVAVDAETFGHHHKNNISFLKEIMKHPMVEPMTISELQYFGFAEKSIEPLESTWGVAMEDISHHRTFPRWDNPDNLVHQLQWQLFNLALELGQHHGEAPDIFDKSLHSDQFWWSSNNPCWLPAMIQRGADELVQVVEQSTKASLESKERARGLRRDLIETGKRLYGEESVGC